MSVDDLVGITHTWSAWVVEFTDEFGDWWGGLDVDRISGSRHHHMKELRASEGGALRVLFAFDPRRQAILSLGGDKSGQWAEWYDWAIPAADDLYDEYLNELREEGLIE